MLLCGVSLLTLAAGRAPAEDGADAAVPDVATLVAAHEQTLGLIHTIDLKMETHGRDFIGPLAERGETHVASIRWSRKGDLERIRSTRHEGLTTNSGLPNNLVDVFLNRTEMKMLRNWDPANPQKVTLDRQGTVRGYVEARTAAVGSTDPAFPLLLTFSLGDAGKPRRTLRELVARSGKADVKRVDVDGTPVWRIRLFHPGSGGKSAPSGSYLDVCLDPRAGYLCRRFVEHRASQTVYDATTQKKRKVDIDQVTTIEGFQDLGDGVWFPLSAKYEFMRGDHKKPTHVGRFALRDVRVNQPLPPETFDFTFPENVIVYHQPVGGKPQIDVYGKNNQVVKTFDDPKKLRGYIEAHTEYPAHVAGWFGSFKMVGALVTMLLVGIVFVQKHRRSKSA